jgi:cytochrome c
MTRCDEVDVSVVFFVKENVKMKMISMWIVAGAMLTIGQAAVGAPDADSANALLKKSDCFKCHALDKKKDGTPFKEVAKKYKGKADAEATLIKHITTKPMVEIDGKKEEHKAVKSTDQGEIKNLVQWILSL